EIKKSDFHILRVLLIGYTSEEQLQYEEEVLQDIADELGGTFRRTRPTDESWFKTADAVSMWWTTGAYMSVDFIWDSLKHSLARGETLYRLKEKEFMPPMMDEYGEKGWVQAVEFGHSAYIEFLVQWDSADPEAGARYVDLWVGAQRAAMDNREYSAMIGTSSVSKLTGNHYGPNFFPLQVRIHELLDPNNCSNPPMDLFDRLVEDKAPYLKDKYGF
ncbi:MAG: hypothetical protein SV375_16150, partial [Thermodesulfobacteriota bacterium]|nr:hypothetical protein [Thermodesulfobacteriota bacterium]